MGVIVNGKEIALPGLACISWLTDPKLRLQISDKPDGERDGRPRQAGAWVRALVFHSTRGIPGGSDHRPQVIRPGLGPDTDVGERSIRFWSKPGKQAGAHLIIGFDGVVYCTADLAREATFHVHGAPGINGLSIGIELEQGGAAELYDGQLDAAVLLADALTRLFGIQRQIPKSYRGRPAVRLANGGKDVVGIYGHRDADSNRGAGDPGDAFFAKLAAAGYERFDLDRVEDRTTWATRQRDLDIGDDGIPGAGTVAALRAAGRPSGLWVPRPGD